MKWKIDAPPEIINLLAFGSAPALKVIEFDDGSGSVLRIQPLRTHRDEAIYECTATNGVGEINTSARLTVLEGKISPLCTPLISPFCFLLTLSFHSRHLLQPSAGFSAFYIPTHPKATMGVFLYNS